MSGWREQLRQTGARLSAQAALDPPRARLARLFALGQRTGIVEDVRELLVSRNPVELRRLQAVLQGGPNIRTVHAIHAALHPTRLAMSDDRVRLTYAEADARINRIANGMRAQFGVHAGATVVLAMENRVEYLLVWFAMLRLRVSVVHASYEATAEELAYVVSHARARLIVHDDIAAHAAAAVCAGGGVRRVTVGEETTAGISRLDVVAADAPTHYPPQRRSNGRGPRLANIVYTSGTTGKPKGAVRDLGSVGIEELARIGARLPLMVGDNHLVVSRLYHSGAQALAMVLTALGNHIHIRPRFDARDTLAAMGREQIHSVFVVPTMLRRLLELDETTWAGTDLSALRFVISGAAEFPHALRKDAVARFGATRVFDFYGATELGWITLIRGDEMMAHPGSVGRPLDGHAVRVTDAAGAPLPPNSIGLIRVQNAQQIVGYLEDTKATQAAVQDGWITVEDTGRIDAEGFLYLAGRARDMIISGGVNVYPVEIEEALAEHPAVREVAVIGLPDPEWGERVVAVVALRPMAADHGGVDGAGLRAWLRTRLSGARVPRQWEFVDALPRNPTGKVVKRQLQATYSAGATTVSSNG